MAKLCASLLQPKAFLVLVIIIGVIFLSINSNRLPLKLFDSSNNDDWLSIVPEEGSGPSLVLNKGSFATAIPPLSGINVISMSLYGSQSRYTMGAIRNAELVKVNFPGWTLRIYTETPSKLPFFDRVPENVLSRLRALGADIHFMDTGKESVLTMMWRFLFINPWKESVPPMMWRFLVADDMKVDRFIVRDSDARLTARDAAAVYEWVKSGRPFHCVRDHPSHANYALSGGMWGGKPKELLGLLRRSWREMMSGFGKKYLQDMNFLNRDVWPKVKDQAYCSDSVSCEMYPNAFPFPIARVEYEHVGAVYNEHDLARPNDVNIIRSEEENPNCLPGKNLTTIVDSKNSTKII